MPQNKYLKKLLNEASGPIAFTFTNDYMFRACLQENNLVLKALVSSLLHLDYTLFPDAPEFYSRNLLMNSNSSASLLGHCLISEFS